MANIETAKKWRTAVQRGITCTINKAKIINSTTVSEKRADLQGMAKLLKSRAKKLDELDVNSC